MLLSDRRVEKQMKNESVKKSLEKSKNVLEEKRKNSQAKNLHKKDQHVPEEKRKTVKQKICMKKTNTFTIIAMNVVQKELKTAMKTLSNSQNTTGSLNQCQLKYPVEEKRA